MNEITSMIVALLAGLLLGAFFFGGLWWTIKKGFSAKIPALWFLLSGVTRTLIVIAGFYYVGNGNWKLMLSCFVGFFIVRMSSTRFIPQPKVIYES
jgi:F1F0 ATPase subunit 2